MTKVFARKYLLPVVLSLALVLLLALWVTYQLLDLHTVKLEKNRRIGKMTVALVCRLVRPHVHGNVVHAEVVRPLLEDVIAATEIECVWIDVDGEERFHVGAMAGKAVELGDVRRPQYVSFGTRVIARTPLFPSGTRLGSVGAVPLDTSIMLGLVLDTRPLTHEAEARVTLFLTILLLGFGGVAVLGFTWSFSIRNRELQVELLAAKNRREQIEELALAAAGLAHETKNPLGIIRGLAQRIAAGDNEPEDDRQMAREIMEEADVTTARLGDFLSYAKLREPELSEVNAEPFVTRITGLIVDDFHNAGIEFENRIDNVDLVCDPDLLSEILLNVLTNSLKFTNRGGKVTVVLKRTGVNRAMLAVSDTGRGIPARLLPNIFKPYVSKRAEGYGIGLAIVKRIVEQLGWRIGVESREGHGTKVIITDIKVSDREPT